MARAVHVKDLGVPTVTRPRGREAAAFLLSRHSEATLVLLDGVPMLSGSFIDGVVLHLFEEGALGRMAFVTRDRETERKLSRIAALHPNVTIYFQRGEDAPREKVVPAEMPPSSTPEFSVTKGAQPPPPADVSKGRRSG